MAFDPVKAVALFQKAQGLAKLVNELQVELAETTKGNNSINSLAESYVLFQRCAEMLTRSTKEINKAKDKVSYETIPERFHEEGIKTAKTESGFRVTVSQRFSASIKDQVAGYEWLRQNGLESLIKPTVNSSSLSAAIKELMTERNVEPPENIIKTSIAPFTSVTEPKS